MLKFGNVNPQNTDFVYLSMVKPPADELANVFIDAHHYWDLQRLYANLASVKPGKEASRLRTLSSVEKACLRGLLCSKSPTEIACQLHREPKGLHVDLARGLYRYVENLTGQKPKNWREVAGLLEQAGYKILLNGLTRASNKQIDWGEAPDTSVFFSESELLEALNSLGQRYAQKTTLKALLSELLE